MDFGERRRDGGVVERGVHERPPRQRETEPGRRAALHVELLQHEWIVVRRDNDEDVLEVLGCRANEAGAADVDLLDERVERCGGVCRRLLKRIQVHDHEIDHRDAVFCRRLAVGSDGTPGENAAVHHRVQRLDAAVHHFRKAGDLADGNHAQSALLERTRRAAGGHEFETARGEAAGEIQ